MFLKSEKALVLNEFFLSLRVMELCLDLDDIVVLEDVLHLPRYTTHSCTLHQ